MDIPPLISVVDDDESVRESLPDLLKEFGFAAQAFSSAEEFLTSNYLGETRCLVLDVAMPGRSRPDLQRELTRRQHKIPIVFITAHRDDTIRPHLISSGAAERLFKPFSDSELLAVLNRAFLLTNSSEHAEAQQAVFVDMAKRAGVRHVVKLSQWAANVDSPVWFLRYHAVIEQKIRDSRIAFTFLRPNLFIQGLLAFREAIVAQGKFFAAAGDAKSAR